MQFMFRSKPLLASSLLAIAAGACLAEDPSLAELDTESSNHALSEISEDGRYIVKFKSQQGRAAVAAAGGKIARELPEQSAAAAYLPEAALQGLRNNPNIEYIEVDPRRYPMSEVTPYGITMVEADQVPASPPSGDAGRVKVCVIDSGLSAAHEDFAGLPVTGTNDSGTGNWFEDQCGHGTHVAGTIAAVANNGIGVVGVAPDAVSLHIIKVFSGADCAWRYSSDLVSALNKCTAAGAKVVNMSLGGSFKSKTEENAFNSAFNNGVLSIAAAGNDGSTRLSYPASYNSVVSVAALDETKTVADFSQKNAQVEIAAPGVAVLSTYPYTNSLTVAATKYNGNGIEGAASGNVNGGLVDGGLCDSTGPWSGKVVLCQRGVISFFDKVKNVQNSGGASAVIYNNVSGGFHGTLGAGNSSTIPAISLSLEDGQALVAGSLGQTGQVASGFGDGYADLDGTSMATPHVAGVAALIWAQVPTATAADVRNALNATAQDLGAAGRDTAYGHGLVQAKAALDFLLAGGGGTCTPAGNACSAASECCSGVCSGNGKNKTCQ